MRVTRDSTIDTLVIVAGILLAAKGFMSLARAASLAPSLVQNGMGSDSMVMVAVAFGVPAFQLLAGAIAAFRPGLLRSVFLRNDSSSRFFEVGSEQFYLRCIQVAGYVLFVVSTMTLLREVITHVRSTEPLSLIHI